MKKNPFEKFGKEEPKEINKSDIFLAMQNSSSTSDAKSVSITKTGKEIKDQINKVVLPKLNSDYEAKVKEINELLKNTGIAPSINVPNYYGVKIDLPYKIYTWEETCYTEPVKNGDNVVNGQIFANYADVESDDDEDISEDDEDIYIPNLSTSKAMSDARKKYNQSVSDLKDIMLDIKTVNVLMNLKDSVSYNLNVTQGIALMF